MNVLSAVRTHGLALSIGLAFISLTAGAAGKNPEPPGFVPPANLLNAIQEATAKASRAPAIPANVVLPTPGTDTKYTPYRSPWTVEQEFGNSQPVSRSAGYDATPTDSSSVAASSLQGGTTMMLSTLPTATGRIPASYDVSPTGAARYTIPIWTPPGARGIEPKLALLYSSSTPDSLMGPGWSLSGLSAITRCNKTLTQDNAAIRVTLTTNDKFCLDGNKLRLTGGTYAIAGSTYQTELETFSRVSAYGTAGNGPSYFIVEGKDGLRYEYGNTTDSKVAGTGSSTPYLWALNKVRDRQGNNMTISYTLSNGSFRPNTISYTQTPATSTAYNYAVVFGYTARTAAVNINAYVADASVQQNQVLTSIDVRHLGTTVRTYNIDYSTAAATGRPRVSAIQSCSATDCLKPTTVNYQDGTAGVASPSTSAGTGATSGQVKTVDVDGDGREDLVYSTASGSNRTWYVRFATASGFGSAVATGLTTTATTAVLFDDLLAQGKTCLIGLQSIAWYSACWNGSSFAFASIGVNLASGTTGAEGEYVTADTDGDGRPDFVRASIADNKVYIRPNNSSGSTVSFSAQEYMALDVSTVIGPLGGSTKYVMGLMGNNGWTRSPLHRIDWDANGTDDVVVFVRSGTGPGFYIYDRYIFMSEGQSLTYASSLSYVADVNVHRNVVPLNFNDDKCTDMFNETNPGVPVRHVSISGCTLGNTTLVSTGPSLALAADYDGDGRMDYWYQSGGTFQVLLSQGNAFATTAINTGISVGNGNYQVFDQNGDGLDDLAYANSGASYAVSYGLHNGAGVMPDLATSITDGFEMNVSFNYKPITALGTGICYHRDLAAPAFPARAFMGPLYTACSMTASDGATGAYSVAYSYHNANIDLQGRGFLGIQRRYFVDSRTGNLSLDYFSQAFPFIGMMQNSLVRQPNGTTYVHETARALNNLSFGSGYDTRSFPFLSVKWDYAYEVGGTLNGQLIKLTTTTMSPDSYGNPTTVTVDATDKSSGSPYYNQTYTVQTTHTITNDTGTNWCLGLPTQTAVISTLPNATSQTRTTGFAVDYANCRTTQEVIEPSSSTLKVTTTYGFDTCGNMNSLDVVGKNPDGTDMPTRTTTSNYGTRCQFPVSTTNPLSQSSSFSYDYNIGLPLSRTDPNGITTSWVYDGYARKRREDRPDATFTTWDFAVCDSTNGYCGVSYLRWYLAINPSNTSGTPITQQYQYFDGRDRLRFDSQNGLGGNIFVIKFYDALDRLTTEYPSIIPAVLRHITSMNMTC